MYCYLHPDIESIGTCTSCGRLICRECSIEVQGKIVCRECLSVGKVNMVSASGVSSSTKGRSIALILEILPGLFGFLGFGWIYAGDNNKGIMFLIGFLAWHLVIVLPISLITAGFGLCVTIPIDLIVIGVSAASLNNHTLQHPELFK